LPPEFIGMVGAGLAGATGAFLFGWVKHGLFPVLQVKIDLIEQTTKAPGLLLVRLAVENSSAVNARLKKGRARLQILEYNTLQMEEHSRLNEWVPFYRLSKESGLTRTKKNDIAVPPKKNSWEIPTHWRNSTPVMTSTTDIEPGESIRIEILYKATPGAAVHCGLQVKTIPIMAVLYRNKRRWVRTCAKRLLRNPTSRFTATAWVVTQGEKTTQAAPV
jgi:hypothetical protein